MKFSDRQKLIQQAFKDAPMSFVPQLLTDAAKFAKDSGAFKSQMVHEFVRTSLGEVRPTVMDSSEDPLLEGKKKPTPPADTVRKW